MTYTRTLLLLALLAAFPPVTTDMYLPALPLLQAQWGVEFATVNLTLVLFFSFFSAALLGYGPLSDSYGRRPLLLAGIGLYVLATLLCGAAGGVRQLILFRILQALGAASASALVMAIARDLFEARERQQLLAHLGVIVALAPMLSPILGGWVLGAASWRWIFFIQACWGALAWLGVLRMSEPLRSKTSLHLGQILGRYLRLLSNRRYLILNLLMAVSVTPMFTFIAGSPAIYISHFQVPPSRFGFFFGANALAMMAGSFTCSRVTPRFQGWTVLQAGLSGLVAGGLGLWMLGGRGPLTFAAAMFVVSFCIGLTRPMSNNLVLEQVQEEVGTAASLLVFFYFVAGAGAMALISLDWSSRIQVIAALTVGCGLLMLAAFRWMDLHWPEALKTLRTQPS